MFTLIRKSLPHDGIMPGARGLKKVVVPKGTSVFCIMYKDKNYWCAYLKSESAIKCMEGLLATTEGTARRQIDIDTLVAWNFKYEVPKRIFREAEYRSR